jgi:hypothetical protein
MIRENMETKKSIRVRRRENLPQSYIARSNCCAQNVPSVVCTRSKIKFIKNAQCNCNLRKRVGPGQPDLRPQRSSYFLKSLHHMMWIVLSQDLLPSKIRFLMASTSENLNSNESNLLYAPADWTFSHVVEAESRLPSLQKLSSLKYWRGNYMWPEQ